MNEAVLVILMAGAISAAYAALTHRSEKERRTLMKKTNKIKGVHILSRTDARSLHALGENSGLIHVEITMTGTPLDGLHLALRNTVGQMGSYILDTWPIEAEDAVTLTAQMLDARDDTADEYADPLRLSIDPEYVAFLVTGA